MRAARNNGLRGGDIFVNILMRIFIARRLSQYACFLAFTNAITAPNKMQTSISQGWQYYTRSLSRIFICPSWRAKLCRLYMMYIRVL